MNIFFTNDNPVQSALEHCDIHRNKMIVEYAQLLSTAHRVLDYSRFEEQDKANIYKISHTNHPSAVWVRASRQHYFWLLACWKYLLTRYREEAGKTHKSSKLLDYLRFPPVNLQDNGWVSPTIAININDYPQIHQSFNAGHIDTAEAYQWYLKEKFTKWRTRNDMKRMFPKFIKEPKWLSRSFC